MRKSESFPSFSQNIQLCLTLEEIMDALNSYIANAHSLFLVHGKRSYQSCGAKSLFDDIIQSHGLISTEYDDFTENPKKEDVDAGVDLLVNCNPEIIIAVGGGSVMDMAKLIRYYSGSQAHLLAMPTTAGTGAESTQFAVCYIDGVKHSISDRSILPDDVILFPGFIYGNSRYLMSCTGFDALAQSIEAYWNINATQESDDYALCALEALFPILTKRVLSNEDFIALMRGANYAGRAINITRTTVPHALSYTLTSKYRYPHGHAVALTFPYFFKYNLEGSIDLFKGKDFNAYTAKMNQLRQLLHVEEEPFLMMRNFVNQLGLGFDVNRDFDDKTVVDGLNVERAKNTPIAINKQVIIEAVKSIRNI